MRTKNYNSMMRDFVSLANAVNRSWGTGVYPYDYVRNGGSTRNGASEENGSAAGQTRTAHLPVNAWTDENGYVIKAYLPGVDPESVDITFEGEELTIQGSFPTFENENQSEGEENDRVEFVRHELFSGPFARRLTFKTPIHVDAIEAVFEKRSSDPNCSQS